MKAIIFDMDGVLFDTESLGVVASQQAAAQQEILLDKALIMNTLGLTTEGTDDVYLAVHPALDTAKFWADYMAYLKQHVVRFGTPLKPHAMETVRQLADMNVPRAICSSNELDMIALYLEYAGMQGMFSVITAGDPSVPSKPAPDMFLNTARKLGVMPANCLAVEDSPNGLRSARAAGMITCMIPDLVPFSDALRPYCDLVLEDLSQLLAHVGASACR